MDENTYLNIIESVHRERTGRFCYVATMITLDTWRLSIVEAFEPGHYPISEDFFVGTKHHAERKAVELNSRRLDIGPREAAILVSTTMQGSVNDGRKREQW